MRRNNKKGKLPRKRQFTPVLHRKKTRAAEYYTLLLRVPFWCTRRGSNPNSTASEAVMLSNYTTGT